MRVSPTVRATIDSPITQAKRWAAQRSETAPPLLDVSQAVPGYPPAQELRDHLAEVLDLPESSLYTDQLGTTETRAAYAEEVSRLYGHAPGADEIAITAGCNQAFCLVVDAIAEPGDEVLLPLPYYFNHDMWLRMRGVRPIYVACDERMHPIVDDAAQKLSGRARAIVLITPNNPTGAIYPDELLRELHALAVKRGVRLILDETYRDFLPPSSPAPHTLYELDPQMTHWVQLYSFSKALSITGYRTGALVAHRDLLPQIAKLVDCVAICPPTLGQQAALYGMRSLAHWRREKQELMAGRVRCFLDGIATNPSFRVVSAGAYFAYVEHLFDGWSSREIARQLARDSGVLALSGDMFGPDQERYLRLAFANLEVEKIAELQQRLATFQPRREGPEGDRP